MKNQDKAFIESKPHKVEGHEFVCDDGAYVWLNISPHFRVYFDPDKGGGKQEVMYRLWDSTIVITGHNLFDVYTNLKTGRNDTIKESTHLWEPGSTEPYLESIEHYERA